MPTNLKTDPVHADELDITLGFSGTPATISPTASLDAAPAFTGTPATISPTAALDAAPTFTGSALSGHSHGLTYTEEIVGSVTCQKLHASSGVTGSVVAAATLLQANTAATASVISYVSGGQNRFKVDTVTGTFNTSDVVTGTNPDTSTFTFTPSETLLDCWELVATPAAFSVIGTTTGPLTQTMSALSLATGQCRFNSTTNQVETLNSDGYSLIGVEICESTTSSVSGGTPAGSNNAPTITVTGASYTPAGSNDAPSITVTGASYTPAGSVTAS